MDPNELFNVKGLVAVITGGSSGLGLMMTKALEANGAIVYIIGRREDALKEATKSAKHGNIIPMQGDVLVKEDLDRITEEIRATKGYVNLLVANAGRGEPIQHILGVPKAEEGGSLEEVRNFFRKHKNEKYTEQYEMNVVGTMNTVFAFVDLLGEGNKRKNVPFTSQIIGMGSANGMNKNPYAGYGYCTSKMAQMFLLRQLAVYLEPWEIRCNILCPGIYPSGITLPILAQKYADGVPRQVSPLNRVGKEEEIQAAILYLASQGGAYCSGSLLLQDGGRLLVNPSAMF